MIVFSTPQPLPDPPPRNFMFFIKNKETTKKAPEMKIRTNKKKTRRQKYEIKPTQNADKEHDVPFVLTSSSALKVCSEFFSVLSFIC